LQRAEARRRFEQARVAHLATADRTGHPHVVPIVFAVHGDTLVSAIDHKPKRGTDLRRLANIAENPLVAVLVDHYTEDWDRLWWVRADGRAGLVPSGSPEAEDALDRLGARYHQYQERRPDGPVILVEVDRWSGWSGSSREPEISG
jgi:PPOX class probable F420-dependent enzyme